MLLLILGDLPVTDSDLQMGGGGGGGGGVGGGGGGGGGGGKKGSKWLFYDKNPLEK